LDVYGFVRSSRESTNRTVSRESNMRLGCEVIFLVLLFAATSPAADNNAVRNVAWSPTTIMTGSPCLFRVEMSIAPQTLTGNWQSHELVFAASANRREWYALAGVDVEANPGSYNLELQATLPNGEVIREQRTVPVERAQYPTEKLRVPQRYVQPDPETLKRIEVDKELKKTAFAHETTAAEWSGDFRPPVTTTMSEGFGTRRTFNGKLASIHRGLDYHAAPGTPVMAANSGEIVLAHELFYEGNCVVVDHGLGFMTIYMHLSHLEVTEGQRVQKGQEVGLSGATGRATGPHLHVAVRWQGAYLDPAQLWTLQLPDLR
jgi:murein DD-endopeptidase MepM/ murein hydrolase activator NlpD